MKWFILFFTPFLLLASPQEDLYRVLGLPETASLETIQRLWIQQGKERWEFENQKERVPNLKTESDPHPETCLAISSQPYVHYQGAVLNRLVPFPVEVVGYPIQGTRSISIMLDTFAREMTYKYGDIEWLQM